MRLWLTLTTVAVGAIARAPEPVAGQTPPVTPSATGRGPVPTPWTALERRRGQRWAVVIGISQYADPKVGDLHYANRDARSLYDFLISERAGLGGFKRENVRLLVDETATAHNIRAALREFLKSATADDVVYIYFAGHGAPDPDRLDDLYLLAYDTKIDSIASTGIPMSDVSEATKRIYAQDLIILIDACHSAGVSNASGFRGPIPNEINRTFLRQLESSSRSRATITASEVAQLSQEDARWGGGHGVFTYYLIQGLNGAADTDGNGNGDQVVSLGELFEYVRRQVRRDTRNAQVPTISPTPYDRNWPMSVVPSVVATAPTAVSLPSSAGGARPPGSGLSAAERARSAAKEVADRGEAEFQRAAFASALPPLSEACTAGNARSCSALGLMYLSGQGVAADILRAFELFRSSCTAYDGRGCNGMGLLYSGGLGVKRDRERAAEFYQRACDDGYSSGCSNVAPSFASGAAGLPKDSARARELDHRAFVLASAACADTGVECVTLGTLYRSGRIGDTSFTKAADYYDRGCRGGAGQGCLQLAFLYAGAQGVPRDSSRAMELQLRACDLGYGWGCYSAGLWRLNGQAIPRDSARALLMFDRSCGLNTSEACVLLGYFLQLGKTVAQDLPRAFTLYQKACELASGIGCYDLGLMYLEGSSVAADSTRAAQLFRDSCGMEYGNGCRRLADMHESGGGVPRDLAKSLELNRKGCDFADAAACTSLARLYSSGVPGLAPDIARAAAARKRACDLDRAACKP